MMYGMRVAILGAAVSAVLSAQPAQPPQVSPPPPAVWMGQPPSGSYIGVGVVDVESDRAKALNLKEVRGVEITTVEDDSPASKAGLKAGDVVLEYNGQRVEGMEQLLRMVRETPAGREVKFGISRNGKPETVAVTTAKRRSMILMTREGQPMRLEGPVMPRMDVMVPDVPRATMSWRSGMLGVEAETVEGGLAEYFGVKQGVLVRAVGKDTAAEKAGLKPGDVITKVDSKEVTSAREVTMTIRQLREKDKKTFSVTVMREKKEMQMPVTLEEPEHVPPRGRTVRQ